MPRAVGRSPVQRDTQETSRSTTSRLATRDVNERRGRLRAACSFAGIGAACGLPQEESASAQEGNVPAISETTSTPTLPTGRPQRRFIGWRNERATKRAPLVAVALAFAALVFTACDPPEPANEPSGYTRVEVRPVTKVYVARPEEGAVVAPSTEDGIVVTTARKLDRPTEVVGVIDEHEPSGRQDAAFALLRRRAAAMGADAVVGVEFHHGEESGEPTHLSGLAVRYTDRLR